MGKCIIIRHPDPRLRQVSRPVTAFDASLRRLVVDMTATMEEANGAGLAAIQIGDPLRVIIIDAETSGRRAVGIPGSSSPAHYPLVNPTVIWRSDETEEGIEGCLSFPGITVKVRRSLAVQVNYQDLTGTAYSIQTFNAFFARALQHEIDHLDGHLLIDHGEPIPLPSSKK